MDITLWVELTLFVCLMALSAFFSSSETSLFSLSKIQLEQLRRDGHASLQRIAVEPVNGFAMRRVLLVPTGQSAEAVRKTDD